MPCIFCMHNCPFPMAMNHLDFDCPHPSNPNSKYSQKAYLVAHQIVFPLPEQHSSWCPYHRCEMPNLFFGGQLKCANHYEHSQSHSLSRCHFYLSKY